MTESSPENSPQKMSPPPKVIPNSTNLEIKNKSVKRKSTSHTKLKKLREEDRQESRKEMASEVDDIVKDDDYFVPSTLAAKVHAPQTSDIIRKQKMVHKTYLDDDGYLGM